MLDIIGQGSYDKEYGPKTKRQMEDIPEVFSQVTSVNDKQEEINNISVLATKMLDELYGWRKEDE